MIYTSTQLAKLKDMEDEKSVNIAINDLLSKLNTTNNDIANLNVPKIVESATYGRYREYPDGSTQGRYIRLARLRSNAVGLTSGVTANVISIELSPGSWNISGAVGGVFNASTTYRTVRGAFSRTSATLPGADTWAAPNTSGEILMGVDQTTNFGAGDFTVAIPKYRVDVTTPFTLYLVINVIFLVSTAGGYGYLEIESIV